MHRSMILLLKRISVKMHPMAKSMAGLQNLCPAHISIRANFYRKIFHETRVFLKYIYASLFASSGKTFPYAEVECKNKHKSLELGEHKRILTAKGRVFANKNVYITAVYNELLATYDQWFI